MELSSNYSKRLGNVKLKINQIEKIKNQNDNVKCKINNYYVIARSRSDEAIPRRFFILSLRATEKTIIYG